MRDKNAGKYDKLYKREFDLAAKVLGNLGPLKWGEHDWEAFTFQCVGVSLVFYPHRTSAGNYHIRVRDQGSSDKKKAGELMEQLDALEHTCTFTRKARYSI